MKVRSTSWDGMSLLMSVLMLSMNLPLKRVSCFSLVHSVSKRTTLHNHNIKSVLHQSTRSTSSSSSSSSSSTAADVSVTIAPPPVLTTSDSPVILLKHSRQSKAFRNGNQLVFQGSIQKGNATVGTLVEVAVENKIKKHKDKDKQDSNNNNNIKPLSIGWGVFNPNSLYRVRILCHRYLQPKLYQSIIDQKDDWTAEETLAMILRHQFQAALKKRQALSLTNNHAITSMYRLVNGEGDSLSGLQVDVINQDHIVIQSSAAWCEIHKEIILETFQQVMPCPNLIWKVAESRLKQDGYPSPPQQTQPDDNDHHEPVLALENGVTFQTFPTELGQKTGVYCDQRENRHTLAQYTHGKTVLDLCCYHGGFSLTAILQGGATKAVGVDSSAAAIDIAMENARINQCADKVSFQQADITEFMQQQQQQQYYDVVVLDPPKLAPTAKGLDRASRKYHALNRDAIKLVNPTDGGLLMTCTCSAAMTQQDGGQYFLEMVARAAMSAGRQVTLMSKHGAASCHTQSPISSPAGAYLTAALFFVHPL
ncbi:large subunit methyltransferase I [Seminavis robusta]|uniref:Large subunit methyltransferase I n=1 Tax=Seminavis robusta TaxID=568900 RepID=A0A9N8HBV1_9STRA|nr:large subunit methyltransferase I [Seminavis robusta]|eukprot:Sro293_g109960.1 large subunit methyltransferase I (536) ;mRNA; f:48330-49937